MSEFKPQLIALSCWIAGMFGYWLSSLGFEELGGVVILVAVFIFTYAFYLGFIQIRGRFRDSTQNSNNQENEDTKNKP